MEEYSILVEDLSKSFGGFTLDHISFKVPKGRIVGVIGERGTGGENGALLFFAY